MKGADKLINDIEIFAAEAKKKFKKVKDKDKPRHGVLHIPDARGGFPTTHGVGDEHDDDDDILTNEEE